MMRLLHGRWAGIAVAITAVVVVFAGDGGTWVMLIAGAIALAGVAWAAVDAHRARHLHDSYAAFASAHGWEYVATTSEYGARFATYPFGTGMRRRQEAVVRGDFNGIRCATFAHVYEERADAQSEQSIPFTHQVTLAELPVALPRIDIVPEGIAAQVAKRLGGRDVDLESHDFNRRWRVLANDQNYARHVLDSRMIDRLIADDAQGMAIRIEGGAVLTWSVGRMGADALASRLAVVTAVARRIPAHVLREYRDLGYGLKDGYSEHAPSWATQPGALTSRQPTDLAAGAGWMPVPTPLAHGRQPGAARSAATGSPEPAHRPSAEPGPAWANEPGALTRRRYTGVGVDADGDGIEDWRQMTTGENPGHR
jgi:hypothetical protein